jgi:DNA-3-methyladenine glycosylase
VTRSVPRASGGDQHSGNARKTTRRSRTLDIDFFAGDALAVARDLIGVELVYGPCSGVIVEVEAYKDDAASHYVTRRPSAGELMGNTHGRVYLYRIYGIHLCLNFTCDAGGPGAVLIRAVEPRTGLEAMRARRGVERVRDLCSGPGKLVEALGIDPALNRTPVLDAFELRPRGAGIQVETTPRIGIREATALPWRYTLRGSEFVSRRPPPTRRGG